MHSRKTLSIIFTLFLFTLCIQAQVAPTQKVVARRVSAGVDGFDKGGDLSIFGRSFAGRSEGEYPGSLFLTFNTRFDAKSVGEGVVTGGSWALAVYSAPRKGRYAEYLGTIEGNVISGTVTDPWSKEIITMDLTITGGTGSYEYAAGSARFEGVYDQTMPGSTLSGSLELKVDLRGAH